jgi:hypothetical protein
MGRPALYPTSIHLTLLPDRLAKLDAWRAAQKVEPTRAEAVRQLLEWAFLKMEEQGPAAKKTKKRRKP